MKTQKFFLLSASFLSLNSISNPQPMDHIEKIQNMAEIKLPEKNEIEINHTYNTAIPISILSTNNLDTTERLINQALQTQQFDVVKKLLTIYQRFPEKDTALYLFAKGAVAQAEHDYPSAILNYRQLLANQPNLNPVRIELAKALFFDKQDNNAREQFQKAQSVRDIPQPINQLIDAYLEELDKRDSWQSSLSVYYLNEHNVNNTSSARSIENTGFTKGEEMLPQKARGFAYSVGIERDFNLFNAHYLHAETELNGKTYWNHHDYDDLYNRTYLGYRHKGAKQTLSVLPFYERRWYGNHRYHWGKGIRTEYQRWLSPNWQITTALEWGKQYYFENRYQNGSNKLASTTLLWLSNPRQYFYIGADVNDERTQVKRYSSTLKGLRFGWGQEWEYGISTRLNIGISQRHFKDKAILGDILPLGKIRKDIIYNTSLNLWKRDWHLFGITPKINLSWKRQDSNLDTLYSYSEKEVRLILEKNF